VGRFNEEEAGLRGRYADGHEDDNKNNIQATIFSTGGVNIRNYDVTSKTV